MVDHVIDFFFSLYWDKRRQSIPDLDRKHAMLSESASTLARKIRQQELKSEDLVTALIERIKEVNPIINAVAADRFEAALAEAKEADALIAAGLSEDEAKQKPFLGVPFTTKECQPVKGMPLTYGLWTRRNDVSNEDSPAIVYLKQAGAIPIASTNLPELLIWQETRNFVYGLTKNPHHTGRSPGGSSGAEAALTASYASTISLCSDIGGSTRMPAFYCGVFGHHPTPGSNSSKGIFFRKEDYDTMLSLGFISKHAEDLGPLTKILSGPNAEKLNLDRDINIKDIKIYYTEAALDHHVSSIRPEMRNAMKRVVTKLTQEADSSDKVPQQYYHKGFNHMYRLWSYWMSKEPDNYPEIFTNNLGEANAIVELIKKVLGQSKHCFYTVLRLLELKYIPLPKAEWAETITKEMKNDLFSKLGADGVLLFPSSPHVTPYHYSCLLRPYNFSYFAAVNTLKCPATQVPLGRNEEGLPVGIQVLAAPYNDALCLAVAKYLEKEFGGAVMACKLKN